jgi:hypothetical protein
MYHVIIWDTQKIYRSFEHLNRAKKYARGLGHTGEDIWYLTGYPPIAYVGNDQKECIYNPRFGKNISSSVGSFINTTDDCLRG